MKIVLFQGGQAGSEHSIPGERPEEELAELLGGEVEALPLNGRLRLVSRSDGEAVRLPVRYCLRRIGRAVEPVAGDCAVISMDREERLHDIRVGDVDAANCYIRPVGGCTHEE